MISSSWRDELIDRLVKHPCCGYAANDLVATEPSALAALGLVQEQRFECADRVAHWLQGIQSADGSVGVRENEREPCWATSLAVMAWTAMRGTSWDRYASAATRGINWILTARGVTMPPDEGCGHDPSIEAWPWVQGTHAWVEPTALHALALKAAGLHHHIRTRNAVRMLIDRQLPQGGLNYGNTFVMDQLLRGHLQPTGMALLALATEQKETARVEKSLAYLEQNISADIATISLSWSLLALAAFGRRPKQADRWLEGAYRRTMLRDRSPLKLALILLAAQGEESFLVKLNGRPLATGIEHITSSLSLT